MEDTEEEEATEDTNKFSLYSVSFVYGCAYLPLLYHCFLPNFTNHILQKKKQIGKKKKYFKHIISFNIIFFFLFHTAQTKKY